MTVLRPPAMLGLLSPSPISIHSLVTAGCISSVASNLCQVHFLYRTNLNLQFIVRVAKISHAVFFICRVQILCKYSSNLEDSNRELVYTVGLCVCVCVWQCESSSPTCCYIASIIRITEPLSKSMCENKPREKSFANAHHIEGKHGI